MNPIVSASVLLVSLMAPRLAGWPPPRCPRKGSDPSRPRYRACIRDHRNVSGPQHSDNGPSSTRRETRSQAAPPGGGEAPPRLVQSPPVEVLYALHAYGRRPTTTPARALMRAPARRDRGDLRVARDGTRRGRTTPPDRQDRVARPRHHPPPPEIARTERLAGQAGPHRPPE